MHSTLNYRQFLLAGALALAGVCLGAVLAHAEPEKQAGSKAEPKKPTGADLYAINCARCHPERYPTEFTSAQWETIMLQMRVRANLPAAQAKEILKYLKENARN